MKLFSPIVAAFVVAFAVSSMQAADPVKSGFEVGSKKITPFHPLNVTGKAAGKPQCLV